MKRWGSGDRFLEIIERIRADEPDAAFRSSFIVGFPGETEADHDELLGSSPTRALDWAGFFPFSREDGTAGRDARRRGRRTRSCASGCASAPRCRSRSPQAARAALVGATIEVLVDGVDDDDGAGRPHAPRGARDRRRRAPRTGDRSPARARSSRATVTRRRRPRSRRRTPCIARGRARARAAAAAATTKRVRARRARARPANFVTLAPASLFAIPTLVLIRSRRLVVARRSALWFVDHCVTDSLDGWLARRDGATRSGAFLDPIADKLIVLGGFAVLADPRRLPVVAGRAHRGPRVRRSRSYRSLAGRRGIVAAGAAARQVQGVHPVLRGRRSCCCRRPPTSVGCSDAVLVGRGRAHGRVRARHRPPRLPRLAARRRTWSAHAM